MNDLYSRKPVATWRIVFYGVLAAAGVAAVGYFEDDHRLYYLAAFAGIVMGGFGFLLSWGRSHIKPVPAGPGRPARFPRWVYWMFYGGVAASSALKLWDIMHAK